MAALEGRAKELLDAPNCATVATLRKDGTVHTVVVWVHTEGDKVTLNTDTLRVWAKHVARDPHVTINVPDAANPYEYVEVRGRVVQSIRGEEADRDINALTKKYIGLDVYPYTRPGEERIKLIVEPDHVRHVAVPAPTPARNS
jgi:PPOX class probable F420-dependent enzyme